jgi:FtsZ-binding cell division protein ZapB
MANPVSTPPYLSPMEIDEDDSKVEPTTQKKEDSKNDQEALAAENARIRRESQELFTKLTDLGF